MHDSKNIDVYLHCGSHPIIEDCVGIRFTKYELPVSNIDELFKVKYIKTKMFYRNFLLKKKKEEIIIIVIIFLMTYIFILHLKFYIKRLLISIKIIINMT